MKEKIPEKILEKDSLEYLKRCYNSQALLQKLPFSFWEEKLKQGALRFFLWKDKFFFRFNREFKGFPLGTFFNDEIFVFGYPHIPRIYTLKTGIKRYLQYPFYVEEKIEGYNVRLVKVKDEILAFTRRGYVCPFATDRWEDFLKGLPQFFEEHPGLVVCCEVAGPENPFISEYPPYIKEDVNFFVFDFMKIGKMEFLKPSEKYVLLEKYNFSSPEINGPFHPISDYETIYSLIKRYHFEGKEGVVFKPEKEGKVIKYVTPYSNIEDVKICLPFLGDIDPNYISLRIIRLILNLLEFKELRKEILNSAGKELFERVLLELEKGEPIQEVFRVRFKKETNFNALIAHFKSARISIEIKSKEWKNGYLFVEFSKSYHRATHFWKQKIEGWGEVD